MQEFAPTKSRLTGKCPSDEELAAYMDGVLDKDEANRIAGHMISCGRCYEIYSEALQFQLDNEPPGNVVPFPPPTERGKAAAKDLGRSGIAVRWLAAAALLLLGVGSGVYFWFLKTPPALVTADVTASLPYRLETQNLWTGPRHRGIEDEEIGIDEASFRLGVQFVNLQVSLKANDTQNASDAIAFILNLLPSGSFTGDYQKDYTALKTNLLNGKASVDLLPEAARLAKESRDAFDSNSLDLGQWVEAGRLAAMAQKPSFFQQPDSQRFLRRLLWRDKLGRNEVKLDAPTRASLDRISDIISKSNLQSSDYAALKTELENILGFHYPET